MNIFSKFFKKKIQPKAVNILSNPLEDAKSSLIQWLIFPDPTKALWKTKDGHELLVSEMSDTHLQNSHALMTRELKKWACLEKEMRKRKLPEITKPFPRTDYRKPERQKILNAIYEAQDDMEWDGTWPGEEH